MLAGTKRLCLFHDLIMSAACIEFVISDVSRAEFMCLCVAVPPWHAGGFREHRIRAQRTHKHKGMFSGNGVRRFTGGSRPQGHLPRLISDGCAVFYSTVRDLKYFCMCHSFMCLFGALQEASLRSYPLWQVGHFMLNLCWSA